MPLLPPHSGWSWPSVCVWSGLIFLPILRRGERGGERFFRRANNSVNVKLSTMARGLSVESMLRSHPLKLDSLPRQVGFSAAQHVFLYLSGGCLGEFENEMESLRHFEVSEVFAGIFSQLRFGYLGTGPEHDERVR